jgi:hypothetical protein
MLEMWPEKMRAYEVESCRSRSLLTGLFSACNHGEVIGRTAERAIGGVSGQGGGAFKLCRSSTSRFEVARDVQSYDRAVVFVPCTSSELSARMLQERLTPAGNGPALSACIGTTSSSTTASNVLSQTAREES